MSDSGDSKAPVAERAGSTAVDRLQLLNQQLAPGKKPHRRRKQKAAELPADWSDVLGELNRIRQLAQNPKETMGYKRHKEAGKLWVRERIEMFLDPGSFREVGSAAGTVKWVLPVGPKNSVIEEEKEAVGDFTPSNNVQGINFAGTRKRHLC